METCYWMKFYANRVMEAVKRGGSVEVELTHDMGSLECLSLLKQLYKEGVGVVSLDSGKYAFTLRGLEENGTYSALKELAKITKKRTKREAWIKWRHPVYERACKLLKSKAVGGVCRFIEETYRDDGLKDYDPRVGCLLDEIQKGIERVGVYLEFRRD